MQAVHCGQACPRGAPSAPHACSPTLAAVPAGTSPLPAAGATTAVELLAVALQVLGRSRGCSSSCCTACRQAEV